MSQGMFKGMIKGNLTSDATVRQAGDGEVCGFRVACNTSWKKEDPPQFVNVSWWGKRGVSCAPSLSKGTAVVVTGNVTTRQYEHNGETRFSLELRADDLCFAGGGKSDTQRSGGSSNDAGRDAYPEAQGGGSSFDDDGIPFAEATGP